MNTNLDHRFNPLLCTVYTNCKHTKPEGVLCLFCGQALNLQPAFCRVQSPGCHVDATISASRRLTLHQPRVRGGTTSDSLSLEVDKETPCPHFRPRRRKSCSFVRPRYLRKSLGNTPSLTLTSSPAFYIVIAPHLQLHSKPKAHSFFCLFCTSMAPKDQALDLVHLHKVPRSSQTPSTVRPRQCRPLSR